MMSARFVILHHKLDDGEHWDLMLEHGDVLLTWRLLGRPLDRSMLPVPAERVGDHRKHYLTYEGPISGDRGDVRRIDAGTAEIKEITDTRCRFALHGGRLEGEFLLKRDGDAWVLEAVCRRPRRNVLIGAALLLTLALLLAHAYAYLFLTDDAFISFRYARNLSEGHGLVFNPGYERVEGYTNFLWVLILAVLNLAGLRPEYACHVLGFAATIALWAIVVWFTRRSQEKDTPAWLVVVPALYLAATRSIAVWSTSGLETRLFEVLVLAACLRLVVEVERRLMTGEPSRPVAALLFALATLTRPDALLIAVAAYVVAVVALTLRRRLNGRKLATQLGVYTMIVGGHLVFRLIYYGQWLPNTYYAKVDTTAWWGVGVTYLGAFALEYAAYLWVPALVAALAFHHARGTLFVPAMFAAVIGSHAVYVAAIGGDHFEYRPLDLYFPFIFLLMIDGARMLCRSTAASTATAAYLTVVLVGLVALPYQSHRQFPDKYAPGFPGLEKNAAAAATFMLPESDPVYSVPGLRTLARHHRELLFAITRRLVGIRQEEHRMFSAKVRAEGRMLKKLIDAGRVPGDMHIALHSVGAITYYTNLRTLDCLGLTDAYVARLPLPERRDYMGHEKHTSFEYAERIGVDFWAIDGVQGLWSTTDPELFPYLQFARDNNLPLYAADVGDGYYLVGWLPQGLKATNQKLAPLAFTRIAAPRAARSE